MPILIRVQGEMTLVEMRQAIWEALVECEDDLAVMRTRNASLFIHPTNEKGENVTVRNAFGVVVSRIVKKAYRSAAGEYKI
ncbi:hypothetical protein [Sinorhizobium meliloti]|nr:hypothetical protein U8C39_09675 [Sinorhizobium meliloti]WQP31725.1 hypothetical protein U8C45_09640 [Sinorhizobium meliloti]